MNQLISDILAYSDIIAVFILTFLLASLLSYKLKRLILPPESKAARILPMLSQVLFPLIILVVSAFCFFSRDYIDAKFSSAWLILWATLAVLRAADVLVVEISIALSGKCQIPKVLRNLAQGAIFAVIFCLVLSFIFEKDIRVLLTSSAILTGILGFAMQGIFSNLVAGAVIHSAGKFNIGDWVQIGEFEGHITQINWSDTWITTLSGHLVSVPNASVLGTTIINKSAPTHSGRMELPFSASYNNPPHEVKQCLFDAVADCPYTQVMPQPPRVLITAYSDFAINYELRVWLADFNDFHRSREWINEAVWYKFKRKGIEIPFPMSGRLLQNFLDAASRMNQMAPPPTADVEQILTDLIKSDFVKKLIPKTSLSYDQLPDLFRTVACEFQRVTFNVGEYIFRQGERDDESLYIFIDGALQGEMVLADGKIAQFTPDAGSLLGEMSFLTGDPRAATIKVLEAAHFLKVEPSTMRKIVRAVPQLMDALSQLVVERTQQIQDASATLPVSQEKSDQIRKSLFRRFWNVFTRDDE